MKLRPNEVVHFKDFVNQSEHHTLLRWTNWLLDSGKLQPNRTSPQRYFNTYDRLERIPPEFWAVRERLIKVLGIRVCEEEPTFKCFVGCNLQGAQIHPHTDPTREGMHHVRCNLILSRPTKGGQPVVNGVAVGVRDGDLWAFMPSQQVHWSTKVEADETRFICSYGLLVPIAEVEQNYRVNRSARLQIKWSKSGQVKLSNGRPHPISMRLRPEQLAFLRLATSVRGFELGAVAAKARCERAQAEAIVSALVPLQIVSPLSSVVPGGRTIELPPGSIREQFARLGTELKHILHGIGGRRPSRPFRASADQGADLRPLVDGMLRARDRDGGPKPRLIRKLVNSK